MSLATVPNWLEETLKADTALQGLVGERIYQGSAPRRVEYPLIVFGQVGPETPVTVIPVEVIFHDGVWQVSVFDRQANRATAWQIADRVMALLHAAHDQADAGETGTILSCVHDATNPLEIQDETGEYYQVAMDFRIARQ